MRSWTVSQGKQDKQCKMIEEREKIGSQVELLHGQKQKWSPTRAIKHAVSSH